MGGGGKLVTESIVSAQLSMTNRRGLWSSVSVRNGSRMSRQRTRSDLRVRGAALLNPLKNEHWSFSAVRKMNTRAKFRTGFLWCAFFFFVQLLLCYFCFDVAAILPNIRCVSEIVHAVRKRSCDMRLHVFLLGRPSLNRLMGKNQTRQAHQ